MANERKYKRKKKLGNYPSFSVVFSITLALFVLGLFGLLISTTNSLTAIIRSNVEMEVYLNPGLSEAELARINKTLNAADYSLKSDGGNAVTFISKEEAAEQFIEDTGEDFMQFLGKNPLKDAYTVKINSDFHSAESLLQVKNQIEKIYGVFEVNYTGNMIQSINENITKISIVLLSIASILILVIIILINNTIKLALFSQRFLIRSMQLVGATHSFVIRPFLWRSIGYGLLAGLIASAAIYSLLAYGNEKIEGLAGLNNIESLLVIFVALIILGILIAVFSTWRAIKKYLSMSLDELY